MSDAYKAIADPNRRKILRLLAEGELNAGEIGKSFDLTPPTLSHHLNILKAADLIRQRRDGTQLIYSLNTTVIQDFATAVLEFIPRDSKLRESTEMSPEKP